MLPYLIAGAIGFVVGKLLEEDEAPKYADGGDVSELNNYLHNIRLDKTYKENELMDDDDNIEQYKADFGRKGNIVFRVYPDETGNVNSSIYISSIGRGTLDYGIVQGVEGKKDSRGEGAKAIASLFLLYPNVNSVHYEDESYFDNEDNGFWQKIGGDSSELFRKDFFRYFENKFGYNPDIRYADGGKLADNIFDYLIKEKGFSPLGKGFWGKSNCTIKIDFSNVLYQHYGDNRVWVSPIEYSDYKKAFIILEFHCKDKNKGIGTAVLKEIIQGADLFGYTIFIEPTSMKKYRVETDINTNDLKEWYSKYDFKPLNDNYSDNVWLRNPNNPDIRYAGGGKVQPKDLTKINNFNNIQKGVDYYSYSDNLEKQEKADRWFELFVINQKEKQLNKIEFNEFMQLSNELAWEDLD